MTAYGKKDLSGTIHADAPAVERALRSLGAQPADYRLVTDAMPPVPKCDGWREPVTLPAGQTCQSYAEPCAFHALLGQLWSRRELLALVEAHEGRRARRFDVLMFARPDLTVVLPMLPWCFHPLHTTRHLHDWVWSAPRAHGAAPARRARRASWDAGAWTRRCRDGGRC